MEKAHDAKRKWREGEEKGKPSKPLPISNSELLNNANAVGITSKDGSPVKDSLVSKIQASELTEASVIVTLAVVVKTLITCIPVLL